MARTSSLLRTAAATVLVAVATAAAVLPGRSAPPTPTDPGPNTDPRLQRETSLVQLGGSLARYLAALGKESGVALSAEPPFHARPLTATGIRGPQAALLAAVARLYRLEWVPSPPPRPAGNPPPGYRLALTPAAREEHARALAAAQSLGRRRFEERLSAARRLALASDAQLRAAAARGDERARALLDPKIRAGLQLAFRLPDAAWSRLRRTGFVELPAAALAPELRELGAAAAPDQPFRAYVENPGPGIPAVLESPVHLTAVRLELVGPPDRLTVLFVEVRSFTGRTHNLLYREGWGIQPPEERRQERPPRRRRLPEGHPLLRRVTLREPAPRRGVERGERPPGARPLAPFLEELARQARLPHLAECDYRPRDGDWLGAQHWLAADIVNEPLHTALDLLAADFDCEWDYDEGERIVVLRPFRWYLEPEARGPTGRSDPGLRPRPAAPGPS
jgi:hypothetical protein